MDAPKTYEILVVDDSDFSRNSIARMLTDERYNIIGEASNAQEAINILNDRTPNIAIIDIVMPGMSGFELAKKMTERFKDVYIIMISSLAQENIVIEAISSGASDFLQKPFTQETLINSLEKIISNIEEA
jgi:two-component system chemotaxis response regulator CheY